MKVRKRASLMEIKGAFRDKEMYILSLEYIFIWQRELVMVQIKEILKIFFCCNADNKRVMYFL